MDEKKVYSLIVTLVCFGLMVLLIVGVAIYTWVTGGFDPIDAQSNEAAIVETAETTS